MNEWEIIKYSLYDEPNFFSTSFRTKPTAVSQDRYQRKMEEKLKRAKELEASQQARPEAKIKATVDLNMVIPKTLSETRKKTLVTFFIEHYIALAKKSNEFRAYGQSLLLVLQAQNLLRILEDLGYQDTKECRDYRIELERLRNVCRGRTEDYWRINWGDPEDNYSASLGYNDSLKKKQTLPLPDPPTKNDGRPDSPILGTELPPNTGHQRVEMIEIHEVPSNSTDL
jgi:hypothetical protein